VGTFAFFCKGLVQAGAFGSWQLSPLLVGRLGGDRRLQHATEHIYEIAHILCDCSIAGALKGKESDKQTLCGCPRDFSHRQSQQDKKPQQSAVDHQNAVRLLIWIKLVSGWTYQRCG
jgi:hypothetical protein